MSHAVDPDLVREVSNPARLHPNPVVSVLMATRNHERYLPEAIEGVVCQETEFPFELLIGEDSSSDATRQVALEYQRLYPHLVRVQPSDASLGPGANARRIKAAARGRYFAHCEGDDYWHSPTKLQQQVTVLEHNPNISMVHAGYRVQRGAEITDPPHKPGLSGAAYDALLVENTVATCTVCLRATVSRSYQGTPFAARGYMMGDYPLWLWASRCGDFAYLPDRLATYRVHPDSLTRSRPDSGLRLALASWQAREDYIAQFGCLPATIGPMEVGMGQRIMHFAAQAWDRDGLCTAAKLLRRNPVGWRTRLKLLVLKTAFYLHHTSSWRPLRGLAKHLNNRGAG